MKKYIILGSFVVAILILSGCNLTEQSVQPTEEDTTPTTEVTTDVTEPVVDEIETDHLPTEAPPAFKKVTSPNDLVGHWSVVTGASYQQISLDPNGYFSTFLHDRPLYDGEWYFDDGVIEFKSDVFETKKYQRIVWEENKIFMEDGDGGREVWEPIEPEIEGEQSIDYDASVFKDESTVIGIWTQTMDNGTNKIFNIDSDYSWKEQVETEGGEFVKEKGGGWEFAMDALTLVTYGGEVYRDFTINMIDPVTLELTDLETDEEFIWDMIVQ